MWRKKFQKRVPKKLPRVLGSIPFWRIYEMEKLERADNIEFDPHFPACGWRKIIL
jgi:hypothetical protein